MQLLGDAKDFGDLTVARNWIISAGCASPNSWCICWWLFSFYQNVMDYVIQYKQQVIQ